MFVKNKPLNFFAFAKNGRFLTCAPTPAPTLLRKLPFLDTKKKCVKEKFFVFIKQIVIVPESIFAKGISVEQIMHGLHWPTFGGLGTITLPQFNVLISILSWARSNCHLVVSNTL
jgi:hypothetical protein